MKIPFKHRRLALIVPMTTLLILGLVTSTMLAPKLFAAGGVGSGGTPGSGGGTYNSDNAFGWRLYNATSSQPGEVASMTQGTWSDVYAACKDVGKVWMFMIFNSSKSQAREYKFTGAASPELLQPNFNDRSGNYYWSYFNNPKKLTNGVYYSQHYVGNASENTVHGYFNKAVSDGIINPGGLRYGYDVGWFCYSDNPPWDITVTSTTDKSSGVIEIGETVTWTHKVINTGTSGKNKTNKDIKWHYETTGDLTDPDGTEQTIASGKPSSGGYPATIGTQTSSYTAQPTDYGKKLCERALASPKANNDTGTYTSTESCVIVSKKPKVQVMGGDLSVGRSLTGATVKSMILTSTSSWSGSIYGSWGEYGLLATGIIEGAASGAAYKGGLVTTGSSTCSYSLLSFANATNSGTTKACSASGQKIGNFTNTGNIPDVASQFKNATANYVDFNDRTKNRIESANTDITIPGGTVEKGNWLVINASGHTVTINGDINYTTDTLTALSDIPQIVIIADRININSSVTNVDAWLIASGTNGIINTCTEKNPTDNLSDADCDKKLTVNGAVMAKNLYLLRTFGNKTGDVEEPAETFNLRADASLWSAARALEGIRINIAASNELPPRF